MDDISIVNAALTERRINGRNAPRDTLRWLQYWAGESITRFERVATGHWAESALRATRRMAQAGVIRAKVCHDPRF